MQVSLYKNIRKVLKKTELGEAKDKKSNRSNKPTDYKQSKSDKKHNDSNMMEA